MSKRQRNRRAKRLRHSPVAGLVIGAALIAPAAAQADTFTVSSSDDVGAGTLRQAITDAEGHPGADDIVFNADVTGPINLASSLPLVTQPLTITDSTPGVKVDGTNVHGTMLSLNMDTAGDPVSISGLTFANGGASTVAGGAIDDVDAALTLHSSVLSGNHAALGGAIYQGTQDSSVPGGGSVTVDASTLSDNNAGFGGAIRGHVVTIEHGSKVSGNYAADEGGGVTSYGSLTVSGSEISGNTSPGAGGGLYVEASLHVPDSTVSIADSTVSGNHGSYGAGANIEYISGSIERSTFSGNIATGKGGGVDISTAPVAISNSTISGNTAAHGGGGVFDYNYYSTERPTIDSSTIAGNDGGNEGGGIFAYAHDAADLPVALSNSIVADNSMTSGGPADLAVSAGTLPIPTAFSLIQNASSSAFADNGHNILGQDPRLGALAENGGPTKTFALDAGSPAIDAGSTSLTTDQRGLPRPSGAAPDMGAFERQVAPVAPISAPGSPQPQPAAVVKAGKLKPGNNSVSITLSCASAACSGNVALNTFEKLNGAHVVGLAKKLRKKKVKVGSKAYALAAGQTRTITVKLNRRGKKLLTTYRKMKVRVSVSQRKAVGSQLVKTGKVTLKTKPKKKR